MFRISNCVKRIRSDDRAAKLGGRGDPVKNGLVRAAARGIS
jgi:hypothetical protein